MNAIPAIDPVIDQELVVHFFAPLDGPQAESACHQVRRLWAACRDQLEMTNPVAGMPAAAELPATAVALSRSDLVAVQQNPDGNRQSVLRRLHDILNLSVVFAQPAPAGLPDAQSARIRLGTPLGWRDFANLWAQTCQQVGTDAMLGEAVLLLGRMPPGETGAVAAAPDLGQVLEPLLPPAVARSSDWWRWGSTTADGYGLWDLRPAADTSIREIVLIAAADQEAELSAWVWSDGTAAMPPFARYLLHAAKVRAEARLVDAWHRHRHARDEMDADVDGTWLASTSASPLASAEALLSRISGLRGEEGRLRALAAELSSLRRTVTIARDNLRAAAGRDADSRDGMFASDQAQAQWLLRQTESDLAYLEIDIDRTANMRALADEELAQTERASSAQNGGAAAGEPENAEPARGGASAAKTATPARRVFVVHGRDGALAGRFRDLLRAVDLQPLEWEALVAATGSAAPYLGQVVAAAPHQAQATLVLLSPDDIVELHSDLRAANDHPYERARAAQARPNVLFELGMALMAYPERTVVVEVGEMRPIADLAGLNTIRFDGSVPAIRKVVTRLKNAGCELDDSDADWLDADRFAGLTGYQRGPDTHREGH
jgi:predicted nucleotide-binding protein